MGKLAVGILSDRVFLWMRMPKRLPGYDRQWQIENIQSHDGCSM
jgi:hypothetical protein